MDFLWLVLAPIAIALPNRASTEPRAPSGHAGVVQRHDDGRDANRPAGGPHGPILLAHRQDNPFAPGDWTEVVAVDMERGGDTGGELAEGDGRRAHIDGLPVAIEDEHGGLVQGVHGCWINEAEADGAWS